MQKQMLILAVLGAAMWTGAGALAIEEAKYEVVRADKDFQVRRYAPQLVAEIIVDGTLEEAGNQAFGRLFSYINGKNRARAKVAMTAPVAQTPAGEKIAMTAPVGQQRAAGGWAITFTMPAAYTLATLPAPDDPAVVLREVPARQMAAVRYSGTWSEERYRSHLEQLRAWLPGQGLQAAGEPVWARYDPPFMPWFLRRNEILIPVAAAEK